ncbi:hypothetical protein H0H92_012822, partial [Tricholoma furcatifolium]
EWQGYYFKRVPLRDLGLRIQLNHPMGEDCFAAHSTCYEFISSVCRGTDNSGTTKSRDRYDEFMRAIRQWRNLKMVKRAGRGHEAGGIKDTKPGDCAVLCPACPQPNINLPSGWNRVADDK